MKRFTFAVLSMPLLAALALGTTTIRASDHEGRAKCSSISLKDLKKAMAQGTVTLLDCNGTETFSRLHIPGAIDLEAHTAALASRLPEKKDALIVCYCANKNCPKYLNGVEAVSALGYTRISHYKPGIRGWTEAGEKT